MQSISAAHGLLVCIQHARMCSSVVTLQLICPVAQRTVFPGCREACRLLLGGLPGLHCAARWHHRRLRLLEPLSLVLEPLFLVMRRRPVQFGTAACGL
jgi:hypothetical protein